MQHTLTIVISEEVYRGLHARVGESGISRYIEDLVQRQVNHETSLEEEYREAAHDEAAEREACEWLDAPIDADID